MKGHVLYNSLKNRGFTQCGKSYMRVVGDGVFQHIFFGHKECLAPSASAYSQNHRREPRILIFLKSMYAEYSDSYVGIDRTTGFSLTVPQLLDKQDLPFMGADAEMERMLNAGLDFLDLITTQHQLIECLEPLVYDQRERAQRYSTQLYDVYLYCDEDHKARMAVETEFAENYFAIMSNCKINSSLISEQKRRFLDREGSYHERYLLTFPVKFAARKNRLQTNYEVNSRRLRDLGIIIE